MPSSDINLHHLTTKGLLFICGAHSPWLTAQHAEGIRGKECGGEGRMARITHTQTSLHILTTTQIYFFVLGRANRVAHISSLFHAGKAVVSMQRHG